MTDNMIPCKHPGCTELVEVGNIYCEKHKALHNEDEGPGAGRDYGPAWRKASKAFLQAHPLCEECRKQGKFVKATVVGHTVPHRGDEKLFWDRGNWRPLCKRCYNRKK